MSENTPSMDLTKLPSAKLLDMLHEYQQAHAATTGSDYDHPNRHHYSAHFYNMRWAVARELERRGLAGLQALPADLQKSLWPGIVRLSSYPLPASVLPSLLKSVSLQGNERWITVHPHGKDEPGVPVLIRDNPDGTAHIIGGAGGSLNFVKLTNIKSPTEYAEHNKQQSQIKRAEEKQRKEGMSPEQKELERIANASLDNQKREQQIQFVKKVYSAVGHPIPEFRSLDDIAQATGVDLASAKIARAREIAAHVAAAKNQVKMLQEQLQTDHELAAKAGLGDISLAKTQDKDLFGDERVGIDLLGEEKPSEASGIDEGFGKRAAEHGVTKEQIAEEGKLVRERAHQEKGEEAESASHGMGERVQRWNLQAKQLEEQGVVKSGLLKEPKIPEPEKIMDVLRAEHELRKFGNEMNRQKGNIKRGVEVTPFVIDTGDAVDEAVVREFSDEAGVRTARALLGAVDKEEGLTKYVRSGAFDTLNEAGLTITANEMLPREAVDFLGSSGAARVLAQRLRGTLSDEEFADVQKAVEGFHSKTNKEASDTAMAQAKEHIEAAKKIELSTVDGPVDIVAARVLNEQRLDHLEKAREVLGTAYGRVTAMGELALALKTAKKKPEPITVDLGDTGRESAITMARSFGLSPDIRDVAWTGEEEKGSRDYVDLGKVGADAEKEGDYKIDSSGGKTFLTLNPSAFDRLSAGYDPTDERAYQQAQSIKQGDQDEDGWMPAGIERRPSTTFQDPNYSLARFDNSIELHPESTPGDLRDTIQNFIGAQVAEGYDLADLKTDLYSPEFKVAHIPEALHAPYDTLRDELFPLPRLTDAEKRLPAKERSETLMRRTEEIKQQVEEQAKGYSAEYKRQNGLTDEQLVELHTQRIPINQEQTPEAIHRTVAAIPAAAVAFTPLGNLDHAGRGALRDFYLRHVAGIQPSAKKTGLEEDAPQKEAAPKEEKPAAKQMNIFGEAEDVDEEKERALSHADDPGWKPLDAEEESPESKAWNGYVKAMGGQQAAYTTIQGIVRGEAAKEYAKNHGQVFGRPLKVGKERLPNWEKHLVARLPEDRLKEALGSKYAEAQKLMAQLARRVGGKFATEGEQGARREAADRLRTLMKDSQLGLFTTDQFPTLERPTIGHDAEKQLASVWPKVAENFGKSSVNLIPDLTMSGDKIKQQRAVKLAVENRRLGLHFGAGSGKSLISIGAFTHLHDQGQAKKAVYAVPSAVQGQFGTEMLRFTTPGKYKWLADPSAERADRFAAYADPDTHMVVTTHQSFRDDLIHAIGAHRGVSAPEAGRWFNGQDKATQRQAVKEAMDHHGWKVDFLAVDEAQGILNRQGKADSSMANAIDACSYHMPNYLSMTGTPVKNDASEAFDVLRKIAPDRFKDQAGFMRKYGVNTPVSKRSLQRLMARYTFTDRIPSGVTRNTEVRTVPLTPKQQEAYNSTLQAMATIRGTRKSGVDVSAVKTLAPEAFEGKPDEEHAGIAGDLVKSGLGGRLQHRLAKIVNGYDYEHNAKIHALRADLQAHKDKPHVIFAHNYDSVGHIQRLCKELGLSVGVVSGKKNGAEKAAVREAFQAGKLNVILNTDAGSTGQNLQHGSVLVNYDTPDTSVCHEQRNARVDRIGQKNDVTIRDYTTDTPFERRARKRLATKYQLADVFQSPSELLDDSGLAAEIQAVRAARRNRGSTNNK